MVLPGATVSAIDVREPEHKNHQRTLWTFRPSAGPLGGALPSESSLSTEVAYVRARQSRHRNWLESCFFHYAPGNRTAKPKLWKS